MADVNDFITVDPSPRPGFWRATAYTVDGEPIEVSRDLHRTEADELVGQVRSALETWPGFDGDDDVVYVEEGWWHLNVNAGKVHEHKPNQPATMHRLCEPVFTKRKRPAEAGTTTTDTGG